MKSFLASVARAEDADYENDGGAGFDEEFAAVEPIDGGAFQVWVGEEGVVEEGGGGQVDAEVKGFPGSAVELNAEVGSDDDEGDGVEGDGADGIFERLLRGMDGIEDVEDAKFWRLVEEQRERMEKCDGEGEVTSPVVEAEIVEAVMRPVAHGTVAERHHDA